MVLVAGLRKIVFPCAILLFVSLFSLPATWVHAGDPVALKVQPEHVGVFSNLGRQQFQAIAVFADGSEVDYTDRVGWSIEAYPFTNQTITPDQVATIDRHGLATVLSSWGRVKIVATYPPPPVFTPSPINLLLLKAPPPEEPLPANAFLPAIYLLLLSAELRSALPAGSVLPAANSSLSATVGGVKPSELPELVPFKRNLADSFY